MKDISIKFITISILLASCAWFDKHEEEKITGDYFVSWNDLESNRAIIKLDSLCDGCSHIIVEAYVSAVGHNDNFIIAEQRTSPGGNDIRYYVIDIDANRKTPTSGVHGPLTQEEFDALSAQLDLKNVTFDKVY